MRIYVNTDASLFVQVRARIEVAVLNFLKILNSPTPAISDLSLVRKFHGVKALNGHQRFDESSVVFVSR